MKRYTPDCSMHMAHEIAFMRETPEGGYVEYQDHAAVKKQRDNLAIRVTELERVVDDLRANNNIPSITWRHGDALFTTEQVQNIYEAAVHEEAAGNPDDTEQAAFDLLCLLDATGGTGATIRKLIDIARAASRFPRKEDE